MASTKGNPSPCKSFSIKLVSQEQRNLIASNKSKNPSFEGENKKEPNNKATIKKRNYSPNHKFDVFLTNNRIQEILKQKTLTSKDKIIIEPHYNSCTIHKLYSQTSSNSKRNLKLSSTSFREMNPIITPNQSEREKSLPSQKFTNERKIIPSKCEEHFPTKNINMNNKLENKDCNKKMEFSKIHEMLTKRISQVKLVDTKPEVIEALCEAYLSTLYEISHQMSPELSSIINSIICGMKNAVESIVIKVNRCKCDEFTKKIDLLNFSLNEANKTYSNEINDLKSKLAHLELENKTLEEKLKELKEKNLPT